ncbi:MAG: hypothetical protein ACE5GA_03460 [Candidatus Zixiibacteriota bacterium]
MTECEIPAEERARIVSYFSERFGISESLFDGFRFTGASHERVYMVPREMIHHPKQSSAGLNIARLGRGVKPSTNFLQMFNGSILKNRLELTRESAREFIAGDKITFESDETEKSTDGYVAVAYRGDCLGCGFLRGKVLRNMLPKSHRRRVKYL